MTGRRVIPAIVVSFVIAVAGLEGSGQAAETLQIGGKDVLKPLEFHKMPVGDSPEHVMVAVQQAGNNISTGKTEVLQGAQVTVTTTTDETGDTYVQRGYGFFDEHDGSTLLFAFEGNGTSRLADGSLTFKAAGIWHAQSGTGRYANGRGDGTFRYEGSPAESVVDWTGTFTPADPQ